MELNEATVLELADRAVGFPVRASSEQAEPWVAERVAEARRPFIVNGIDSTPPHVIEQHEAAARTQWDRDRAAEGVRLEAELAGAEAIIADRMAAAKVLPPTVEPLVSRTERQLEEFVALLVTREWREHFATRTRQQALDAYTAADEQTQAGRRLVTFIEQQWTSTAFRDDPDRDAIAISRLKTAIEARQLARVPQELIEWRNRIHRAQRYAGFTEVLRHLRSGRGIASRPTPATLRLA
jgi:hypothetical protein